MTSRPKIGHAALDRIAVADDCLVFAGRKLPDIAAEVGRTPFYAYSRQAMSERVALLRHHLPAEIEIHYAVKANPMPAVVEHMLTGVDGIDVASQAELEVALAAGANVSTVSFAGPGKSVTELERAIAAGIAINLESFTEAERVADLANSLGKRARVAVRVNPDFELKTSGMKMSGGPKQFGVDAERVPDLLAELSAPEFEFEGLHIFSGSQNLSAEAIIESQAKTIELAERLAAAAPGPIRTLNIGGGFGIPYFPGDKPLDLAPIGEHLRQVVARCRRSLPEATLVVELGRFLVGEAGIYVCRILDKKVSRGQIFLITDGGLHHHLAASGNFGQVLRKNYPVLIGNRVHGASRAVASVVGPLCTPLDLLADRMELADAQIGDLVAVLQSGAYGLTASPLGFLSHPAPAEVLL
ncbi:MAG: pyridoxal-dependent decarboxylase, exosortase A system-associated [Gammaproteobacteria bacterium]